MMSALPQTATQTGLASLLAALGPATQASPEQGGFEQLFASLPGAPVAAAKGGEITIPTAPAAAALLLDTALPAIEMPASAAPSLVTDAKTAPAAPTAPLAQPVIEMLTVALPVEADALAGGKAASPDAALAASLLIAAASPATTRPVASKAVPAAPTDGEKADGEKTSKGQPAEGETSQPAAAPVAVAVAAPTAPPPVSASAMLPVAAKSVANKPAGEQAKPGKAAPAAVAATPAAATDGTPAETPAADISVAGKAEKPVAKPGRPVTDAADAPDAPASAPARPRDVAPALPAVAIAAAEPRAAKPAFDAGAAVTVLFNQPELQGASPIAAAAKGAPIAERVIDMTSDDQWIAQLAADIAATKSDKGDISFRLVPRHLGRLDVSMLAGDDGVSLKLDTQHEATATLVTAAQPRLVEDLRQQGVRVAGAEVTCTPGETGRQSQQGQGRAATPDASHLIETSADRADQRGDSPDKERTADRRGRFA